MVLEIDINMEQVNILVQILDNTSIPLKNAELVLAIKRALLAAKQSTNKVPQMEKKVD